MILKYNKFIYNNLIKEAIMNYDEDFIEVLSNINFKYKNDISNAILSTYNKDIDNRENYIKMSDRQNDMVKFKSNDKVEKEGFESIPYSDIKVGKIIRRILDTINFKYKDKDIEDFVNYYKTEIDIKNNKMSEFKIIKGNQIKKYYLLDNYSEENEGTLQKSCMAMDRCQKFLNIYTENENKISLLIQLDKETNKIKGRALIWKIDSPNITLMDRIYTTHDSDVNLFKEYANKNGWYYKLKQNTDFNNIKIENDKDFINNVILKVKLDKFKFDYYPYLDTIPYLTSDGTLTNNENTKSIGFLRDTDGESFHCINCEGVGNVPCENCLGEGCAECDNIGSIDCDLCKNVSIGLL